MLPAVLCRQKPRQGFLYGNHVIRSWAHRHAPDDLSATYPLQQEAGSFERTIRNCRGFVKKKGVLLTLRRYEKLMEDLHDLAVVAERRSEEPISLDEMKRRLKENALL